MWLKRKREREVGGGWRESHLTAQQPPNHATMQPVLDKYYFPVKKSLYSSNTEVSSLSSIYVTVEAGKVMEELNHTK